MSRRKIPAAAAIDDRRARSGLQRLNHNFCAIELIVGTTFGQCEEHIIAARSS
jgi:hypothetical protein